VKLALGLFTFDILSALGDWGAQSRYCHQAVAPFLSLVASDARYRVTVAAEGAALEFLAREFPGVFATFRSLIAGGQIELASALYAPTLWPAFPGRDLLRSVALNRQCLAQLGLPAGRVFVGGPDGFFSAGLGVLAAEFDAAVASDDYLRYWGVAPAPAFWMGKTLVIVGCNRMLLDVAEAWSATPPPERGPLPPRHRAALDAGVDAGPHARPEAILGNAGSLEWRWYHLGGAHEVVCTSPPRDWEAFFHDPTWAGRCAAIWQRLLSEGWAMSTVSEFAAAVGPQRLPELPVLPDGPWQPKRTHGMRAWLGGRRRWQPGVTGQLPLAWRARSALARLEPLDAAGSGGEGGGKVAELWRDQLVAESASAFSADALPAEAAAARNAAEVVLAACARLGPAADGGACDAAGGSASDPPVQAELVEAEGLAEWFEAGPGLWRCEARFAALGTGCGIRFAREGPAAAYCPCGLEAEPTTMNLSELRPSAFYLPLPNGLVGLGSDLWLVRDNRTVFVAARLGRDEPWVSFLVDGLPEGRWLGWQFFVYRGGAADAAKLAAGVNNC
jgi:hypothetical protein